MLRSWPIQVSVYGALVADSALMAMIQGVYDQPDQNAQFPYITLGEDTNVPDDLLQNTGSQNTQTIHTWSRSAGMAQVKQIMDRIYAVMHRRVLTVSGTQVVDCVMEFDETFMDSDGQTRHGVQRCRIRTFEP